MSTRYASRSSRATVARGHLRRAFALILFAVTLAGVAPIASQSKQAAAAPLQAKVVFTAWGHATPQPRICTVDTTLSSSVCSNLPIVDARKDGTSGAAVADLNHDNRTDVVVANENGTINVCLDDGAGGWTCSANGTLGRHNGLAIADLNGDSHLDILGVIETEPTMVRCLGNGTGAFTCVRIAAPAASYRVEALDADADGDADLAIAAPNVGAFLCANDGAANFTCAAIAGVSTVEDLDVADLDSDGDPDLAFAAWGPDDLVCYGGTGTSFTCSVFHAGGDTSGITIGDLDANGDLDIVLAQYNQVSRICLGNGARTFVCSDVAAAAGTWRDVEVGELTGDNHLDLAVATGSVNLVCAGNGAGNVIGCSPIDSTQSFNSLGVAVIPGPPLDTDGDGIADMADNCDSVGNPSQLDTDADTEGDACDLDDDADGLTDSAETGTHGTNPLDPDTDGDGWTDLDEIDNGGDALNPTQSQTVSIVAPSTWLGSAGTFSVTAAATSGDTVTVTTAGSCTINILTVSPTGPGACTITSSQPGGYLWLPATATHSVQLLQDAQSITVAAPLTIAVGTTVAVSATSDSGLPVTLSVTGPCSLAAGQLTATGVGGCTITASQLGDTWRMPATATAGVNVVRDVQAPSPTTTTATTTTTTTTTAPGIASVPTTSAPRAPTTAPRAGSTASTAPAVVTTTGTTSTSTSTSTSTLPSPSPTRPNTNTNTNTNTSTTSVDDATQDRPAVRVTVTVDLLVSDGLPDASTAALRLALAGLPAGTTAEIDAERKVYVARRIDGEVVFDLPAGLDLSEATLVIRHPDGTVTRVTSTDSFTNGSLSMDLEFQVDEGAPAGAANIRAFGLGFRAGTPVQVTMHSDPVLLATLIAGPDGSFDEQLELPADVDAGEHRILISGESDDGPITGAWNFAVDSTGAVERVGDPSVEAAVAGSGLDAGAIDAAASGTATIDVSPTRPDPSASADAGTAPTPIDAATGLATFQPTAEPEEAIETAIESFALISLVGAGGSLLAAGMAAAPMSASGGTTGSSSGGSGGDGGRKRGKGKVAGGKAAKLGDGVDGTAWGDRSPTWRWPLTDRLDRAGVVSAARLHHVSPLAARVIADGSTMRAAFGSGALLAPALGVVLGVIAAGQTGGHAVAPSLGLVLAIAVLGVLDASSGLVAVTTFGLAVAGSGGLHSADSVRSLIGLASMWIAGPLIAGGARAFRRPPSTIAAERWQAAGDVILGSLLAAWAIQSVVGSLPALSGLDMPVASRSDLVAGVVLAGLVVRYLLERAAVRWYPDRLGQVTFTPSGKPGHRQQVLSTLCKAALFVFVILPYIGPRWQLWAVTAMTIGPSLLGLVKDRFPKSALLHRLLPRGVPNTLVMITVGTVLGAAIAERIDDPADLLATSFVLLSLPGFALSLLGLFGRDGAKPTDGWTRRWMGAIVVVIGVLKVRGYLGDSPWLPLLAMCPAGIWWLVATRHRHEVVTLEAGPGLAPAPATADWARPACQIVDNAEVDSESGGVADASRGRDGSEVELVGGSGAPGRQAAAR